MSLQHIVAFTASCFCVWLVLATTFGVLFQKSDFFTVHGTFDAVDNCSSACVTSFHHSGCIHHAYATLSWSYLNESYRRSNYSVGSDECGGSCCYHMVNRSIQVEIDPAKPSIPLYFWSADTKPFSSFYLAMTAIFGTFSCLSGIILLCVMHDYIKQQKRTLYTQF